MSEGNKLRPVKTSFHKLNDVPTFFATNAWAVDTAENAIVLKFYTDCSRAPEQSTQELINNGTDVSPKMNLTPDTTATEYYEVIREFQCGVVLSPMALRAVHDLLGRIIAGQKEFEK